MYNHTELYTRVIWKHSYRTINSLIKVATTFNQLYSLDRKIYKVSEKFSIIP